MSFKQQIPKNLGPLWMTHVVGRHPEAKTHKSKALAWVSVLNKRNYEGTAGAVMALYEDVGYHWELRWSCAYGDPVPTKAP